MQLGTLGFWIPFILLKKTTRTLGRVDCMVNLFHHGLAKCTRQSHSMCLLLYVRLPPSRQRTAAGPLAPSEPPDKSQGGPTEPPNQQNNNHTTKGAQPWVRTKPHHTAAVDTCTPDRERAEPRKTPICHRSWGSIAMNGGPNGFLNKRQPSMSLMNLHHALTMENPAETRRQHLARLRRNIMVRRSLRTLPHNMVPSAKTRTTFPNTIRSRIIFATAPKCSRRKRSARAHRPRFRARPRKLARLFPINAMKILTGKAINIVIPPIGSDMLTKTPSTPSISDNVLPQANFFIHTEIQVTIRKVMIPHPRSN